MIGYNNNREGGVLHLDFPDLKPQYHEKEIGDFTNTQEIGGIMFGNEEGGFTNSIKNSLSENGQGRFHRSSQNFDLDLHLGQMDTQKDFFRVFVNGRRAAVNGDLNNFSMVLEMHHGSNM
jgi:hypothetical protein